VVSNQTAGYEKLIENNLAESGRGLFQGTTWYIFPAGPQ
jgi:hypothetical protein